MRAGIALALAALVVAFAGYAAYVRFAPSDPGAWHVDPLSAPSTGQPNAWRVGPEGMGAAALDAVVPDYAAPAAEIAAALDAFAMGEPATVRLAGGPGKLWTTYVQRSQWMKYPDYVTVRVYELGEEQSSVAIYSRARFGQSDLGVNRARVEKWLEAIAAFAQ